MIFSSINSPVIASEAKQSRAGCTDSGLLRRGAGHRAGHFGPDPLAPRNDDWGEQANVWRGLLKRSGLGAEELAPALGTDIAVDDLAGVRRLPLDASVALLIVVRMIHIFGVGLTDLLLRRGARHRSACGSCADRHGRSGNHHASRNSVPIMFAVAHNPLREVA